MDFPKVACEFKDVLKIVANVAADDRGQERKLLQVEVSMFPSVWATSNRRESWDNLDGEISISSHLRESMWSTLPEGGTPRTSNPAAGRSGGRP
jgi:hypothetical protein